MLFRELCSEAQIAIAEAAMGVSQNLDPRIKSQVEAWARDQRNFIPVDETGAEIKVGDIMLDCHGARVKIVSIQPEGLEIKLQDVEEPSTVVEPSELTRPHHGN